MFPQIGKAGTPYAKTVKSLTQMPVPAPDAGIVFDSMNPNSRCIYEHNHLQVG